MSKYVDTVVSMRIVDRPWGVAGSTTARCDDCRAMIWLDPDSQRRVRKGLRKICGPCALAVAEASKHDGVPFRLVMPGEDPQ